MRICIFGAGAVGGNFGARLSRAGIDVTMIARGPHLEAMQARGLTVQTREDRIHVYRRNKSARCGWPGQARP